MVLLMMFGLKPNGDLIIVDYKAKASKDDPSTFLKPKTKKNGDYS